jgi:hypothetical protein
MTNDPDPAPGSTAGGTPRAMWWVGGVLVLVIIGLVVALVVRNGEDGDDVADRDAVTGSTEPSTTSTSTTTTEATTTSEDASATTGPNEPPADLSNAATTPVSVPAPPIETAQLTAVRVGTHEGYVRVVFEFTGELPGYDIGYVDGPVREDGSGDEVAVEGERVLSVRMTPASGVVLGGESFTRTYTGPDRIAGGGGAVTEVVEVSDFESQMTWAIGTTGGQRFAVSDLSSPTRLVIDVVNE